MHMAKILAGFWVDLVFLLTTFNDWVQMNVPDTCLVFQVREMTILESHQG